MFCTVIIPLLDIDMDSALELLVAYIGPMIVAGLGWLLTDTRAKAKISFLEPTIEKTKNDLTSFQHEHQLQLKGMELKQAESYQERQELRRLIERLEETKASREAVDGFRNEINILRVDMDKRFDRLEKMLQDNRSI